MATKITQATALVKKPWTDNSIQSGYESMDGTVANGSLQAALAKSETTVFYAPDQTSGKIKDRRILAQGIEFGGRVGGEAVDTSKNTFVGNGGTEYSLVVSDNGQIQINKYLSLASASASGTNSWEYDTAPGIVTFTGSYAPYSAQDPDGRASEVITQSWALTTANGATVSSNSGNTITLSVGTNQTPLATFTVTQNYPTSDSTTKPSITKIATRQVSYTTRKYAVFVLPNKYSTVSGASLSGLTTGGFKFKIGSTEYTTGASGAVYAGADLTNNFFSGTSVNGTRTVTLGSNPNASRYIYIITDQNPGDTVLIRFNGGMAKDTYRKIGTITTYSNSKTYYVYCGDSAQTLTSASFSFGN